MVRGKLPPRKIAPSPNFNANPKPNPDPDRGAIFLGGNFQDTNYWYLEFMDVFKSVCVVNQTLLSKKVFE